jgi:hypothetical protein
VLVSSHPLAVVKEVCDDVTVLNGAASLSVGWSMTCGAGRARQVFLASRARRQKCVAEDWSPVIDGVGEIGPAVVGRVGW